MKKGPSSLDGASRRPDLIKYSTSWPGTGILCQSLRLLSFGFRNAPLRQRGFVELCLRQPRWVIHKEIAPNLAVSLFPVIEKLESISKQLRHTPVRTLANKLQGS
ncbi:hypothetical protein HNY73_021395 [Argiope bruennichi]|uniref:Uncharacterized protein n=1 Tax=Argiope bruennichi TaxID=94029 RepID=A0A8T0E138_ARGBR|nr:hypothetical protein HNY73_021395 [Argiope bruennichi]